VSRQHIMLVAVALLVVLKEAYLMELAVLVAVGA
jgi:hypothetical protein